jgi:hypothetical protein
LDYNLVDMHNLTPKIEEDVISKIANR